MSFRQSPKNQNKVSLFPTLSRSVHRVDTSFLEVVTVALSPLPKVSLLSCFNILSIDHNKAVSVRSGVFVDEPQCMNQLMHWGHQPALKAPTVEKNIERSSKIEIRIHNKNLLKFITCIPPVLPSWLLHMFALSRMRIKSTVSSVASLKVMQETLLVMYSIALRTVSLFATGKVS